MSGRSANDEYLRLKQSAENVGTWLHRLDAVTPARPDQLLFEARSLMASATELIDVLGQVIPALEREDADRRHLERWTQPWLEARTNELREARRRDDEEARRTWRQTAVQALVAGRWSAAWTWIADGIDLIDTEELLQYSKAVANLEAGAYTNSDLAEVLQQLSDGLDSSGQSVVRSSLLVWRTRIEQLGRAPGDARSKLLLATELAPEQPLPLFAMGQLELTEGRTSAADNWFSRALSVDSREPHGFIGMGMIAENVARTAEADRYFDDAAARLMARENDPVAALRAIVAPAAPPAALLYRLALALAPGHSTKSLSVVEELLTAVPADSERPAPADLYRLKGELLSHSDPNAAADAFTEAGRRFNATNKPHQAKDALLQARKLQGPDLLKNHAATCWELAEAWNQLSYQLNSPAQAVAALECVREGETLWDETARRFPPSKDTFWTLLTRAMLAGRRAALTEANWKLEAEYVHQALMYIERSLALNPSDDVSWALLGKYYGHLELYQTALSASERAMALYKGGENTYTPEQRLVALANAGEWSMARDMLISINLRDTSWRRAVEAYIQYAQGDWKTALDLLRDLAEVDIGDNWILIMRATCCELAGEKKQANETWDALKKRRTEDTRDSTAGEIAFYAGEVQAAADIATALLDNPLERAEASQLLTAALLRQKQWSRARSTLQDLLKWSNRRQVSLFRAVRLAYLRPELPDDICEEFETAVEARLQLPDPSPDDELRNWLAESLDSGPTAAIAIHTALGRYAADAGLHDASVRHFRAAGSAPDALQRFPELRAITEREVIRLVREADSSFTKGFADVAMCAYEYAVETAYSVGLDSRSYRARAAYAQLVLGRRDEAHRSLAELLSSPEPATAPLVAGALSDFLDAPAILDFIEALNPLERKAPRAIGELREALVARLGDHFGLRQTTGFTHAGAPLALELPPDLRAHEVRLRRLGAQIRAFRDQLRTELGSSFPAVKIRERPADSERGAFVVRVQEAPVAIEAVSEDTRIAVRFQAAVLRFASHLISLEEAQTLLDQWTQDDQVRAIIGDRLATLPLRVLFADLLRRMIDERVPLTRPAVVVECVCNIAPSAENDEWLRPVRLRLRDLLPGNRPHDARVPLPEHMEDEMRACLQPHIASEAAERQRFCDGIAQLAGGVAHGSGFVALVVRDPDLREPLHNLIHARFPDTFVLSKAEIAVDEAVHV